ncbi:putative DNA mismatch repair protein MutS [Candidatus Uzinura diaspidicola str. ASNER]|uniref:DNA mismatch repair protein MutS n=1 Tax=Candidatus Uzinura diaspidicola str. ASNER TaxID=1133592 RepID=L7VJS0_9FLAO|nr:putative DNA mismatch repair protein MutS [Candidatus Uzinura diaspidicola str. ASNER]
MAQYHQIKSRYPEALLLFRVGDFYETFEDDAIKCSESLNIVLTNRSDIKLAGFPHHALNNFLPKLVQAGYRVAICDQLEDPKKTKGIVKRGITHLVTPGLTLDDQILQAKSNNFLAALHFEKEKSGVAFLDISTGEFLVAEEKNSYVKQLIKKISPSEIIYQKKKKDKFEELLENNFFSFAMDDWVFQYESAYEKLTRHFQTSSLKGFGVENLKYAIIAAGAIFNYLDHTHNSKIRHISSLRRIDPDKYVWMDDFTIKSLEILESNHLNGRSLLEILDSTLTFMGSRLLKRWIIMPIKNLSTIYARYNLVEALLRSNIDMKLTKFFKSLGDIERLTSKVIIESITPRELMNLSHSLVVMENIKKLLSSSNEDKLNLYSNKFPYLNPLYDTIRRILHSDPAHQLGKGNVIASGVSKELDELRALVSSLKKDLERICLHERKSTGIPLKISFNNVFGYYIEIRNIYKNKVPENWMRKQTLVNSERYITEELKSLEIKILGAEEKILSLEKDLFKNLVFSVGKYFIDLQKVSKLIAHLDVLFAFANNAKNNEYVRPIINNSMNLYIKKGRHPVIEKSLPFGTNYVANDLFIDNVESQILIITGPNMAGKSAVLRQTALIVLMAHFGSYVPAQYVYIGYIDKIFSRVGASDNISLGESTFMVEMNETASILNNMSKRSLIILDEIGRGTSTYDGASIAWAVVEYLHEHPKRPKTLFATHYHELHKMSNIFKRIKNFNVSVREIDGNVIFLRKLIPGESKHSLGLHVAKIANMPPSVLKIAKEILDYMRE